MRRTLLTIGLLLLSLCSFADSLLQGGVTGAPGWTGRAFGQRYVITIVGWQPADMYGSGSVLLGVFEGANRPDFMDAVPLHIGCPNSSSTATPVRVTTANCVS